MERTRAGEVPADPPASVVCPTHGAPGAAYTDRTHLSFLFVANCFVGKGLGALPLVAFLRTLVANQQPGRPVKWAPYESSLP